MTTQDISQQESVMHQTAHKDDHRNTSGDEASELKQLGRLLDEFFAGLDL